MRTDAPMTTDEALTAQHGWTLLASWDAAYSEVCDSVESEYLSGLGADDDAREQGRKAVADAVTNAWDEGLSHDEWMLAALRRLRR